MTNAQLAEDYRNRGYYTNSSASEIHRDITRLINECIDADKHTRNGKFTVAFNKTKIAIAYIILNDLDANSAEVVK